MSSSPIKVVLTGGTGFLGTHLSQFLSDEGFLVHNLKREDFSSVSNLAKKLSEIAPQFVIHLAAKTTPGRDPKDWDAQQINTLKPSLDLAQALVASQLTSLRLAIFCGSCEEYGNTKPPFSENGPLKAFSPYGLAKIASYYGTNMICEQANVPWCWIRPFLMVGPGKMSGQLLPLIFDACIKNEELPLTPAEQTRDFIAVTDVCRMISRILKNPEKATGETFNLASGQPSTIRKFAETVQKLCEGRGKLKFGEIPYRSNEAMSFYASTEKFNRTFGEPKLMTLEEMIQAVL